MKRVLTHPLTLVALAVAVLYGLFAYAISPPLPRSLLVQYMLFAVIGVLMVATFDDATCRRLFAPPRALLGDPAMRLWRGLALVVVVAGVSTLTYGWVKPKLSSPVELRTVHPAPPSSLKVFGKRFDLLALKNPVRATAPKGSAAYAEAIAAGRQVYYKNCVFCHGDRLAGGGVFAPGFNPRPANFQDVGTIAQLQESYVFWRISTGGPGLPREGAPWASAMPVWHEMLSEDDIWRVIMFLYDYTGHVPRSWELSESNAAPDTSAETAAAAATNDAGAATGDTSGEDAIARVYANRCAQCHGAEGEGDGPAAPYLYPKPRDFSLGVFKYKTTHADSEFPSDDDLRKTIREGLPATGMPAWKGILSAAEIDGLIEKIKEFGGWDGETPEDLGIMPIDHGTPVKRSPESLARGAVVFKKACVQCHGAKGRGNVTSGKKLKDDWRDRIWPRNLTRPETWRWTRNANDIFERISAGIRGTPMPEHTTTMSIEDRWSVANYVMTLRDQAVPFTRGDTVIRARRVDGPLPESGDDPAWDQAPAITFPLVPNVIKKPRLFFSLNDAVTVRALYNDKRVALRLDIDDRSYSVPGDPQEVRYRQKNVTPTADAAAIEFPAEIPAASEKPWFRHGDRKHPVNIWYWRAPSVDPEAPATTLLFDASGPDAAPAPRDDEAGLSAAGKWRDGQWRLTFSRRLDGADARDIGFEAGRYIPIAFANWDGWAGQTGARHTLTPWYWLLLVPEEKPLVIYGASGASGLAAGFFFLIAARRERRRFTARDENG